MARFIQDWQWIHNRNENHWMYWYSDNGTGEDYFDEDIGTVTKTRNGYLADPYGSPTKLFRDLTSAKKYVERYAIPRKPVKAKKPVKRMAVKKTVKRTR